MAEKLRRAGREAQNVLIEHMEPDTANLKTGEPRRQDCETTMDELITILDDRTL